MKIIELKNLKIYGVAESQIAASYPRKQKIEAFEDVKANPELLNRLLSAPLGSGHDCAAKGVVVQFDLTAPEYFWRQLDRYSFIDYVSSQSKMHSIQTFPIREMCNEEVDEIVIKNLERLIKEKAPLRKILSNVPSGFMLTARMTTNILQLKTIFHQRKNHQLPEWQAFTQFIIRIFSGLGFVKEEEKEE